MSDEPLVNERILNGFAAILRCLEDIKEGVERLGKPATPVADLHAEVETCGRSASEPEPTTDEHCENLAAIIDNFADELSDDELAALAVARDSLLRPCPDPLMPAIEAGLLARAEKKWLLPTFLMSIAPGDFRCILRTSPQGDNLWHGPSWDGVAAFLEAECPAPSEPETERDEPSDLCSNCKHEDLSYDAKPCIDCKQMYVNKFAPKT